MDNMESLIKPIFKTLASLPSPRINLKFKSKTCMLGFVKNAQEKQVWRVIIVHKNIVIIFNIQFKTCSCKFKSKTFSTKIFVKNAKHQIIF